MTAVMFIGGIASLCWAILMAAHYSGKNQMPTPSRCLVAFSPTAIWLVAVFVLVAGG